MVFTKGQKPVGGRKAGTPNKNTAEVKKLAGQYSKEVIETLIGIVRDEEADAKARVSAANILLDRAAGKPSSVDPDGNPGASGQIRIIIGGDDAKL